MKDNKYFKESELACNCCGEFIEVDELVNRLTKARELAGVPFVINSGYRCPQHNENVGGVVNSSHTFGYAADIKITDTANRYKILTALLEAGFERVGVYRTFIHVDVDPNKVAKVMWHG